MDLNDEIKKIKDFRKYYQKMYKKTKDEKYRFKAMEQAEKLYSLLKDG